MTKFMEWIKSLMVLSTSLMNRRIITLRLSVGLENFILVWTLWHKILFKSAHYHYRVNMCSCKILSFWLEKGLYTCGAPDLVTGVQLIWWHKILCSWTSNNVSSLWTLFMDFKQCLFQVYEPWLLCYRINCATAFLFYWL